MFHVVCMVIKLYIIFVISFFYIYTVVHGNVIIDVAPSEFPLELLPQLSTG